MLQPPGCMSLRVFHAINHVSKLKDGCTAVQGIDDDYVWSMLIAEETGGMTLSISGEDTGYIIFGACHPD